MITLNEKEKRTVRLAAIGLSVYLVLFFGWQGVSYLEAKRVDYQSLVQRALKLKLELQRYETDTLRLEKLKKAFHMEPAALSREALIGKTSQAIQQAAAENGIKVGPMRESSARSSSDVLASMRFEGTGSTESLVKLLHRLEALGYPLIVESVQANREERKPGMVTFTLEIVLLDFERWKKEGEENA